MSLKQTLKTAKKVAYGVWGLPYPLHNWLRKVVWPQGHEACLLLSFDVDYRKDEQTLPEMLDVLAKANMKASFACIGRHVENNPAIYRRLFEAGHEILNHSYNHPNNAELCPHRVWWQLSHEEKRSEIYLCQDAIAQTVGQAAEGFRLPHFGNVQDEDRIAFYHLLEEAGFKYSSSMLDFRLGGQAVRLMQPSKIWEIGVATCPLHPYTAMDSYHIMRSSRLGYRLLHQHCDLLESLFLALDAALMRRQPLNIYLDPHDLVNGRLEKFLQRVAALDIAVLTYRQYLNCGQCS